MLFTLDCVFRSAYVEMMRSKLVSSSPLLWSSGLARPWTLCCQKHLRSDNMQQFHFFRCPSDDGICAVCVVAFVLCVW